MTESAKRLGVRKQSLRFGFWKVCPTCLFHLRPIESGSKLSELPHSKENPCYSTPAVENAGPDQLKQFHMKSEKRFFKSAIASFLFILCFYSAAFGIGQAQYVTTKSGPGAFPLVQSGHASTIWIDSGDWPGVIRAANDLKSDIARVTGVQTSISTGTDHLRKYAIIIGTIGRTRVIDDLVKTGKIDAGRIRGKWESFSIQVVSHPMAGVTSGLVIAGSDKRGTIYGIYDLSEQMGVSPWYWWADVPVPHKNDLFVKPGTYQQGEPSVKYRGIFLNDESPDLTGWVTEKFGTVPAGANPPIPPDVANYNSKFYSRLFELILRLKGNYLWPAMWNNAFNEDDPKIPGSRMNTESSWALRIRSRCFGPRRNGTGATSKLGSWNYYKNPEILQDFWREGIRRNRNYESIITIGLRGADDTPMIPGGTVSQSMELLEQIVGVQRKIIAEEIDPDVTKTPQLWCLYKEVQEYYKEGLRVPDDVTLLWADDNWGNIRRLPTEAERQRAGGAGVYYHFDYVGGPRNYKWINTNPIPKIWEQMTLAKEYGADRIWIVNVGHFKSLEFPSNISCISHGTRNGGPIGTSTNIHAFGPRENLGRPIRRKSLGLFPHTPNSTAGANPNCSNPRPTA